MDPTETMRLIHHAVADLDAAVAAGDRDAAQDAADTLGQAADGLTDWLGRGGAMPASPA